MDIQYYRNFLVVAKEENMTRAANILHISQSALSKQIKSLEDSMEKQLFVREPFALKLTTEGREFTEIVTRLIELTDQEMSQYMKKFPNVTGSVSFGMPEISQLDDFSKFAKIAREKYPDVKINLSIISQQQALKYLDEYIIDFAVVATIPERVERYHIIKIPQDEELSLLVSANSPLAELNYITPESLMGHSLFSDEQIFNSCIRSWAGEYFSQYTLSGQITSPRSANILVREGIGSAFTLDNSSSAGSSDIIVKHLNPPVRLPVYLLWKKNSILSTAAEAYKTEIKKYFETKEK